MKITTKVEVPIEWISNLLCSALTNAEITFFNEIDGSFAVAKPYTTEKIQTSTLADKESLDG